MNAVTELRDPEIQERARPDLVLHRAHAPVVVEPLLFADVLLEIDGTERRRRRWAAIFSAVLQSLTLAIVFIVPLMLTEALPKQQLLTFLVAAHTC